MNTIPLQAGKFDSLRSRWSPVLPSHEPVEVDALTLLTYNVWFDPYYAEHRYPAVLDILRQSKADFIALQEVTPEFLSLILKTGWIQEHYYCSDTHGMSVEPHGVLLLSRFPMRECHLLELPSLMDRKFLFADFWVNGHSLRVGTLHLESQPQYANWRVEQMQEVFPLLAPAEHAILMGDFNFHDTAQEESRYLDPEFIDLWPELRPGDPGYTEDTDINLMRLKVKGKPKQVRFDRILLKSESAFWEPADISMLGTEPVKPDMPEVFPSDHFGLSAKIGESRR